jgi:hypothetical protein
MLSSFRPEFPNSPDRSVFAKRGGKLIIEHGWADLNLSPNATVDYYEQMAAATGGMERTRNFARLFMQPGGNHCGGGLGPWISLFGSGVGGGGDSHLTALEAWVEQNKAPNFIVGTNPDTGASRPICAYPKIARLISPSLDPSLASSFECVDIDE